MIEDERLQTFHAWKEAHSAFLALFDRKVAGESITDVALRAADSEMARTHAIFKAAYSETLG